jgi:hypothetical protein
VFDHKLETSVVGLIRRAVDLRGIESVTSTNSELRQELLRSRKFLEWQPTQTPIKKKASYGKVEPFINLAKTPQLRLAADT